MTTLLVFFTGTVTGFFFERDYKLLRSIKSKMVMSTKMSNVNSWSFNPHHNIIISTHLLCEM